MSDTKTEDRSRKEPGEQSDAKKPRHKPQPLDKAAPDDSQEGEGSPGLTIGGGGGHA